MKWVIDIIANKALFTIGYQYSLTVFFLLHKSDGLSFYIIAKKRIFCIIFHLVFLFLSFFKLLLRIRFNISIENKCSLFVDRCVSYKSANNMQLNIFKMISRINALQITMKSAYKLYLVCYLID